MADLSTMSQAFFKSFIMTIVSEVGDKTFFVAALMAMRHPRTVVLVGALGALLVMTVISVLFGWAAPNLMSPNLTNNAATFLFFAFGIRSLWDGITDADGESELAEVEAKMNEKRKLENGVARKKDEGLKKRKIVSTNFFSPVLFEAFSLTFLGEWGDRSQIATIGLAAQENAAGVALGGFLGHALCTAAAVWGGKHLAAKISERMVALSGGVLFLLFGIHSIINTTNWR